MKLKELIAAIDPTKADKWQNGFWDFEKLGSDLGVYNLYDVDGDVFNHIKEFPLHTWNCTDTMVGWNALYLNNELICISYQAGRKCDKNYFWASKEMAEKTREYLLSALVRNENLALLCDAKLEIDPESDMAYDAFLKQG